MNYYALIKLLYPNIRDNQFELGYNEKTEVQINKWSFSEKQPSIEYLQSFRDKMNSYPDIESAGMIGMQYLKDTDYKAIRVCEGYEMSQEDKDARELSRKSIRALQDFKVT